MSIELDYIRKKLKNQEIITGYTVTSKDQSISELIGLAGFDFVWIEAEHAALSLSDIQGLLIGARAGGAAGFVRCVDHSPSYVKQILDMGPDAIIFPFINNAADAEAVVSACLYPPKGIRGFNPMRASNYGQIGYVEAQKNAANNFLRIMIIEQEEGIKNIEEIVQVDGVDAIVLGPGDLSLDLGFPGDLNNPAVQKALKQAAAVCRAYKKPFLVYPWDSLNEMKNWIEEGASFFNFGYDLHSLSKHLKNHFPILEQALLETRKISPTR